MTLNLCRDLISYFTFLALILALSLTQNLNHQYIIPKNTLTYPLKNAVRSFRHFNFTSDLYALVSVAEWLAQFYFSKLINYDLVYNITHTSIYHQPIKIAHFRSVPYHHLLDPLTFGTIRYSSWSLPYQHIQLCLVNAVASC